MRYRDISHHTWSLHEIGVPNLDTTHSQCPVTVRRIVETTVSNPAHVISALGFEEDFEFLKEGFVYYHPRDVVISVSKVKRLLRRHEIESGEVVGVYGNSYLVEVVCVGVESGQRRCIENVRYVAKQLGSVVMLRGVTQKEMFEERQRKESLKQK
jgi:hypothetical protein